MKRSSKAAMVLTLNKRWSETRCITELEKRRKREKDGEQKFEQ
jgi:hypothetical protein